MNFLLASYPATFPKYENHKKGRNFNLEDVVPASFKNSMVYLFSEIHT